MRAGTLIVRTPFLALTFLALTFLALTYLPMALASSDNSNAITPEMEQQLLDIERFEKFQQSLGIEDATMEAIMPIILEHRSNINALVLQHNDGQSAISPKLKNPIVKLQHATAKRLSAHLDKQALRRWKRAYTLKFRSSFADRVINPTSTPNYYKNPPQNSMHHQGAAQRYYDSQRSTPQKCD